MKEGEEVLQFLTPQGSTKRMKKMHLSLPGTLLERALQGVRPDLNRPFTPTRGRKDTRQLEAASEIKMTSTTTKKMRTTRNEAGMPSEEEIRTTLMTGKWASKLSEEEALQDSSVRL